MPENHLRAVPRLPRPRRRIQPRPPSRPRAPLAPTGRHAIARGNAPGKSPTTSPSPERARFHTAIPRPNPRTPPPRRTGRRGRPACEIYWRTRIPALAEEIRRRVCGTLGVGVARVSPFQGWVGWGALFPGRCPGLSPLAALRPTPAPLAHPAVLPCCGQRRPRWRTPPSCRVAANADPIGAHPTVLPRSGACRGTTRGREAASSRPRGEAVLETPFHHRLALKPTPIYWMNPHVLKHSTRRKRKGLYYQPPPPDEICSFPLLFAGNRPSWAQLLIRFSLP